MLYNIINNKIALEQNSKLPLEKILQNLLVESGESDSSEIAPKTLREDIFGIRLLIIGKEVYTKDKKRSDILCLDENGDAVIIELKKDNARLGIETQALQYLSDISSHTGKEFVERFKDIYEFKDLFEEHICSFLGWKEVSERLNKNQSIFLVANGFDKVLFSIGDWLFSKNISFKCIAYSTYKIQNSEYISFSVQFDRMIPRSNSLQFTQQSRDRKTIFYFNIGTKDQERWDRMIHEKFISCGFDGVEGDRGSILLNGLQPGDKLVCYASGKGVIGICEIPKEENGNSNYSLVDGNIDPWGEDHKHRLKVEWIKFVNSLDHSIKSQDLKNKFGIYHPIQTLQIFPDINAFNSILTDFDSYINTDNS
jgi:hypothetical protein